MYTWVFTVITISQTLSDFVHPRQWQAWFDTLFFLASSISSINQDSTLKNCLYISIYDNPIGGTFSVMVTVEGNGYWDSCSKPERGCLHFT